MGLRIMHLSGSSHEEPSVITREVVKEKVIIKEKSINPDPYNWKLIRSKQVSKYCVMDVLYPDCTNFEGRKILVLKNITHLESVKYQGNLDPHFTSANVKWKPIARFEPTKEGWKNAIIFCQAIQLGREE